MEKRKLFLLFLSAMSLSIIVMVIIYGLFIKDINFDLNVKNPETAPSPIDVFNQDNKKDESKGPARITTPNEIAEETEKTEKESDNPETEETTGAEDPEITEMIPLEPQTEENESYPIVKNKRPSDGSSNIVEDSLPSLHYVYLDGFSSKESAEQAIQQLQSRNLVSHPYIRQHKGQIILQFGVFSDRENAEAMAQQLKSQNVFVKVD